MRFYTQQHKHYCGSDLPAKAMDVCLLDQHGTKLVPQNLPTPPQALLRGIAPYRDALVVGAACLFTWDWLAALCAQAGLAFVLGHALSRKALHGGKAKPDTSDAPKSAVLLRGGRRPLASVSPPERRATRDLRRRRCPLRRQRAEVLAPMQHTTSQSTPPECGKQLADKGNREGVAEHFPAPSVRKTLELDLTLLAHDDQLVSAGALSITRPAKGPAVQTCSRRQSVPGIGQSLAVVSLSESQASARFPRVPDFLPSGRRVKGAKESAGKRHGLSGQKLGTPQLQWACAAAAGLCVRQNQRGQAPCAKLDRTHGQGQALPVLAQPLARAVDCMRTRHPAGELTRWVAA
jgi:transposase